MDLNYLLARHQTSLMRAVSAACPGSRSAHTGLARGYAERIDAEQRFSKATFPLSGAVQRYAAVVSGENVLVLCRTALLPVSSLAEAR